MTFLKHSVLRMPLSIAQTVAKRLPFCGDRFYRRASGVRTWRRGACALALPVLVSFATGGTNSLVSVARAAPAVQTAPYDVETIVLMRHGEKPHLGMGQLSCQGLNRAIALPRVLEAKFGKPDAIFAPDPSVEKEDAGTSYAYVRPLATLEPTAIWFGMPVSVSLGFAQKDELRGALNAGKFRRATLFVAGEHRIMEQLARDFLSEAGEDAGVVPKWASGDFDSLYVLRISREAGKTHIVFRVDAQGLNGRATACPGA